MGNRRVSRASRWAAPIVVTVALGCQTETPKSGCEPPDCHMNPPGIEPSADAVDPEPTATVSVAAPEPSATAAPEPSTTAAPEASAAELPSAPAGASVQRRGDQCFYHRPFNCPEAGPSGVRPTCNPPAPQRVKCPSP